MECLLALRMLSSLTVWSQSYFLFQRVFYMYWGKIQVKGKNKWTESMQWSLVFNRGDRLLVYWEKWKNTLICQFWTLKCTAGKSGQFSSIPSSFIHESLEPFALSLPCPQAISSLKVRLTLLMYLDTEFIRYQKPHIVSNFWPFQYFFVKKL